MTIHSLDLPTLIERFGSEDKCRRYLEALRWPDGIECPRCESDKISRIVKRNQFDCDSCRYQFSVTASTIFNDSHLPLWKWFLATYVICESKKGISANQLKRMIGVSYKTAWYLAHRIRFAMADASILSGIVEVDETYVGGKAKGKGHGYRGNKSMVIAAIERGGKVRLKVEKRPNKKTLHTFIRAVTDDGDTEAIYTDSWPAYRGIGDRNTKHDTVNHLADEWVRGDVHTNTVEGVFSLLKRSIVGSYHQLSAKHLEAYLGEMGWRFNNRDNAYLFRDTLKRLVEADPLEYKNLIAKAG
jgi:transposase-like protein